MERVENSDHIIQCMEWMVGVESLELKYLGPMAHKVCFFNVHGEGKCSFMYYTQIGGQ